MKSFISYLFLTIFALWANSQAYLDYHRTCSNAVVSILDGNYHEAHSSYDSIFQLYKPFPKDLSIASQNAALLGMFDSAKKFLLDGASLGLGLAILYEPAFCKFRKEKDFELFEKTFLSLSEKYYANLDLKYRNACITLVHQDQSANKTHKFYNRIWPFNKLAEKQLSEQDSIILKKLDSLVIINNGLFPFRHVVGGRSFEHPKMRNNKYGTNDFILSIVFIHFPQAFHRYETVFFEGLLNGELHCETYGLMRTFCGRDYAIKPKSKKEKRNFPYKDYKYYIKWPDLVKIQNLEDVNQERKKIGYLSVESELRLKSAQYLFYKEKIYFDTINCSNKANSNLINFHYANL
jgi:hypothetical protein